MERNNDYPASQNPTCEPLQFDNPMLRCCVRISTNVRRSDGLIHFCRDTVLVKNGLEVPYSRAGGFVSMDMDNPDNDGYQSSSSSDSSKMHNEMEPNNDFPLQNECAYLILEAEVLQDDIHGKVFGGLVLRRRNNIWETTGERCAIKEMPWDTIRRNRRRNLYKDPSKEMAAMQHFQQFYMSAGGQANTAFATMCETKVIVPLDHLYDDQNLYNITPFCADGDLFEALNDPQNLRTHFTEDESRHTLKSILDGLEWLQRAGLCHRDIRLENIMVAQGNTVITNMGMCLKIPYRNDTMANVNNPANVDHHDRRVDWCLIAGQPSAGKPYCMSPEIYEQIAFDGHAIDMWAVGVCLYVMLIGRRPWEWPTVQEDSFRHMTNGYMGVLLNERILPHYNVHLSTDVIDLLQRMLFNDPTVRLSLQQVRRHPWMME